MPRLPEPGKDAGAWGAILNEYLSTSIASDGQLKTDSVGAQQLRPSSVTNAALVDGTIQENKLHSDVVAKLNTSNSYATTTELETGLANKVNSSSVGVGNGIATLDNSSKLSDEQVPVRLSDNSLSEKINNILAASNTGLSEQVLPIANEIDIYGESTTENASFETHLASYTGLSVTNRGVSGQGISDALMRMGAIRPRLSLSGGQIPAGTFNIPVTSINPDRGWRINGSGSFAFGGTILGLNANLSHNLLTNQFSLVGTNPGTAIAVTDGTAFIRSSSAITPTRRLIVWVGRNNVTADMVALSELVMLASDAQTTRAKEFLVIGVINGAGEAEGSVNYNRIIAYNERLKQLLGPRFYDIRPDFIERGLSIRGISASGTDTSNIAADKPPASLWEAPGTGVHPNSDGYLAINYLIAEKLQALGWATNVNLPEIPNEVAWESWTSDSFNRADGSFGSTDASNGGTAQAPLAIDAQVGIIDNQFGATTNLSAQRWVYFDTASRESAVELDFIAGGDCFIQIGRVDANNSYIFEGRSTSGTGIYERTTASGKVPRNTATQQLTTGRLRFECYFTDESQTQLRMRALLDGTVISDWTDTSPAENGTKVAIGSPSSGTTFRIDNLLIQRRVTG